VKVPMFNFLMIDGQGDPNNSIDFQDGVQALYSMSYTMKFMYRKEKNIDYPVMALEGIWWMKDNVPFDMERKEDWLWTLMIMQPKYVTKALVRKAAKQVQEKKGLPSPGKLRFESFNEGLSVQILHIGPYDAERENIEKLHEYAHGHGYEIHGRHHEIYLSDPRRVKPEKWRTVVRHAVRKLEK
jgi:hypothetical protein